MERFQITKIDGASNAPDSEQDIQSQNHHQQQQPQNRIRKTSSITLKAKNLMRKTSKTMSGSNHAEDCRKYSLAQLTKESLPRLDNYRTSKRLKRPSMGELHGDKEAIDQNQDLPQDVEAQFEDHGHANIKLGWIVGVMIPCLLNIWGVMLFLRLSWVVGQSGIIQSLVIIGISALVCVITTLSLSAISTNGEVRGGGVYFIISRSLGPEFGASVGVVFAFANAVAASMNTIGFCNSLNDLLSSYNLKIIDGGLNDVRIVGCVTILVLILICCVGMEWETKAQNFLIATIVIAIFDFIIGCIIGPQDDKEKISKGFVGFQVEVFKENMKSEYRYSEGLNQNFFSVFAIFFPSVTGIQAGANISGDLKNPSDAIPKGTMLALIMSMISYALFVIFAGGAAVRDASGNLADYVNGSLVFDVPCKLNNTCEYGLQNSYSIMQLMSVWGPLIYAGCFAATLSTALTNLLSVPRLIQALGEDQIYPKLIFFSKPYGKHGEPYRGYVLTFIISSAFVLIAELNVIAPLISNFYLASYALINFCTFHAAFVKPLGWRPTFKYYNAWLSLAGFFLCVAIMFLIEWVSSLITFVIIFILYLVVIYRKPDVNWGSSTQAQTYKTALSAAQKLQSVSDHVKNYRPQVLVLAGDPKVRPSLIDFAHLLTKHKSLMIVAKSVPIKLGYKTRQAQLNEGCKYLSAKKIKAFYSILDGISFEDSVNAFIKTSGFGKMSPNILLMGYKSDWITSKKEDLLTYFNILHNAFSSRMGVVILRHPDGLDFSDICMQFKLSNGHSTPTNEQINGGIVNGGYTGEPCDTTSNLFPKTTTLLHADSNLNLPGLVSATSSYTIPSIPPMPNQSNSKNQSASSNITYFTMGGSDLPKNVIDAVTVFTRKQPKGTIDVWWLYDDGGLTMLLPYIVSMRSNWSSCKLRVLALTNRLLENDVEEKNMAALLTKMRINYSELIMLQGVTEQPCQETIEKHEKLLESYKEGVNNEIFVPDIEKLSLQEKTYRQLRLHELVVKHSSNASLIFMSLPLPRQEAISAPLYMSWLEMLTRETKCPCVLVRGNQTPVLTLYS